MVRYFVLILLVLVLVGCTSYPQPGNYYAVKVDEEITPSYRFCEAEACWNVAVLDAFPTPVPFNTPTEEFATPTPTPTITPIPTTECWITATGNVNVRSLPSVDGAIWGQMTLGMRTRAEARSNNWFKIWWPAKSAYGWTSGTFYSKEGDCDKLLEENPT